VLHVAAGAGNVLLQLSHMLDFEGNETVGNSILNYLQFSYDFLSIMKVHCTELYCLLMNNINVHYTVVDMSVTDSRLNLTG
jgi:hypothetical protein